MQVTLVRSDADATPWGFRLQGGLEKNQPISIYRIGVNSVAERNDLRVGDVLEALNGLSLRHTTLQAAQEYVRQAGNALRLVITREQPHVRQFARQTSSPGCGTLTRPLSRRSATPQGEQDASTLAFCTLGRRQPRASSLQPAECCFSPAASRAAQSPALDRIRKQSDVLKAVLAEDAQRGAPKPLGPDHATVDQRPLFRSIRESSALCTDPLRQSKRFQLLNMKLDAVDSANAANAANAANGNASHDNDNANGQQEHSDATDEMDDEEPLGVGVYSQKSIRYKGTRNPSKSFQALQSVMKESTGDRPGNQDYNYLMTKTKTRADIRRRQREGRQATVPAAAQHAVPNHYRYEDEEAARFGPTSSF